MDALLAIVLQYLEDTNTLVVDKEGRILFISAEYAKLLGTTVEAARGQPVEKVVPGSRMREVLATGQADLGQYWPIGGRQAIIHRYPIWHAGRVIGAVACGVFANLVEATSFAARLRELEQQLKDYQRELAALRGSRYTFASIVGTSSVLSQVIETAKRTAQTPSTVLIEGETGTGKELFAHAIHSYGPRASRPFVRINCAAIPAELLESELFGYEPGAFTGASRSGKRGLFEAADRGTLLLDEIEALPLHLQPKLLRALEEGEIRHLGGQQAIPIDVKIIAISNVDLEQQVRSGHFRSDLFYRLNVIRLRIPPLRERKEDIPLLVAYFLPRLNRELGVSVESIAPAALQILEGYSWPGNVRQLRNALERSLNLFPTGTLTPEALLQANPNLLAAEGHIVPGNTLREATRELTQEIILNALKACGGNKAQAARLLGIHRSTLYKKLAARSTTAAGCRHLPTCS
ncbi:MAG TPA: sigma 54-interacting transcriptional regulator [Firmicutes bacterium]|nr:sigma 54-interacting transcriptional regulator [Bacillota bacterium]